MIIPVHMLAFSKDRKTIRQVEIPDGMTNQEDLLEAVFHNGQNDFQNDQEQATYSVSVGDVAEVNGKYFMVMGIGWKELTKEEFEALKPPTSLYAQSLCPYAREF